jgi:hypothetical protein
MSFRTLQYDHRANNDTQFSNSSKHGRLIIQTRNTQLATVREGVVSNMKVSTIITTALLSVILTVIPGGAQTGSDPARSDAATAQTSAPYQNRTEDRRGFNWGWLGLLGLAGLLGQRRSGNVSRGTLNREPTTSRT